MRHRLDIDTFREIGDSLFRNKRRTILTGFGIFWGLFMLLFLVGGGQGIKQMLSMNFEGFATNTIEGRPLLEYEHPGRAAPKGPGS